MSSSFKFPLLAFLVLSLAQPRALALGAEKSIYAQPAESVTLLESIFNRFGNLPQIAMNQAAGGSGKNLAPGSVDYALAIRPKETSKGWVAPSPALSLLADNRQAGVSSGRLAQGGTSSRLAQVPAAAEDKLGPETWKGGTLAREQILDYRSQIKADNSRLGFWEKDKEVLAAAEPAALEGAVLSAPAKKQEAVANVELKRKTLAASKPQLKLQAEEQTLELSKTRARQDGALEERYSRNEVIALLPPHVATGIPLVSLGVSQAQVTPALASMGTIKNDKINGWTVLSWQRQGETTTSLQLFFRQGLLDAIRIFDKSLIARDFGVFLGDELQVVKQKFGEPAFLVQEPRPGNGQNYIYPISRVGFQLVRGKSSATPQVASVLIFSVK
ncbi:MAG: hypothetical protein K2W82_01990 [Candidatus Obscuribacterales bacterium]|nr:hypothetical protein [Candidatus Obscuribacterales bacterium]